MITRYGVWLNGQALHDADPALYVTDIQERVPVGNVALAAFAGRDGQHVLRRSRQALQVDIHIAIRDQDPARRKQALDRVKAWAALGGWLSLSDRPDQRLYVEMDTPPTIGSSLQWTQDIIIPLMAYGVPYWEQAYPTTAAGAGASGECTLFAPGNAPTCFLSFYARNTGSAALTTLTVQTGDTAITLDGLSVAPGETVSVSYDHTGLQQLPVDKRTADSADDLVLRCGVRSAVAWSADQPVDVMFETRGRWL